MYISVLMAMMTVQPDMPLLLRLHIEIMESTRALINLSIIYSYLRQMLC
jgi:hypothetical protein